MNTNKGDRSKVMASLHENFAEQVEKWTQPEEWRAWLDMAAQFNTYSARNVALIVEQCPTASLVRGYRAWQGLGRQVRKGERAIRIFGGRFIPEDDSDDDEAGRMHFFPVSVFDIEQTDIIEGCEAVPDHPGLPQVAGADIYDVMSKVSTWLTDEGWTVERGSLGGRKNGETNFVTGRIVIRDDLAPAMAALTMLHEATHALLHKSASSQVHRGRAEVEAESTAYLAAKILGFDTSAYSVGYVASWASDEDHDVMISTADTVMKTARKLVNVVRASAVEDQEVTALS